MPDDELEVCEVCDGTGEADDGDGCFFCHGTGVVEIEWDDDDFDESDE